MRATKLVTTIKHLKYKERLQRLKLPTLRFRRIRGDTTEVHKILTCRYCKNVNLHLELHQDNITRGPQRGFFSFALPYRYHKQIFVCVLRICNMTAASSLKTIAFSTYSAYTNPNNGFFTETTSLNQ